MASDIAYARVPNGTGPMKYQDHTYEANNQPTSLISETNHESKFRVYPNPSNTRIYLLGNSQPISVFNMMGQKICFETQANSIDISNWESGVYFIKSADSIVKIIKK